MNSKTTGVEKVDMVSSKYSNMTSQSDDEATSVSTTMDDISELSEFVTNKFLNSGEKCRASDIIVQLHDLPISDERADKVQQEPVAATLDLKDVKFLKVLGEGQFGQVWLATKTDRDQTKVTSEPMAVKVLSKYMLVESGDKSIVNNLIHEVEILREIHCEQHVHPCLVQMIEAIQDDNLIYIFQEFCSGGELFSLLHNDKIAIRNTPNAVKFYTACIADALYYLHQHGIIYRDLKPENIMIRPNNGYPVLIDFGYAKHIKKPRMEGNHRRKSNATISSSAKLASTRSDRESKVFDMISLFENNNKQVVKRNSEHVRRNGINKEVVKRNSEHVRRSGIKFHDSTIQSQSESARGITNFNNNWSSSHRRQSLGTNATSWHTCNDDWSDISNHSSSHDSFHNDDDDEFDDSFYVDAEQYEEKCYSMVGTPKYVAPEIILGNGYDYRVDLWALGIVLYEMLANYNPMIGPNDIDNSTDTIELYRCITEEDYVPLPNDIASKESEATNLIDVLLQRNPNERIQSSYDVLHHSWFSNINFHELRQQRMSAPWIPFEDNDNCLDTKHFDDWTDIANDPDKCIFKSSYTKLKKKEMALFDSNSVFRR